MGGMATYAGAADNMTKMGLAEAFLLAVMAAETQAVSLLNQKLGLAGIMGIMTDRTAILQRGMDILPFKTLPVMAFIAGLIHSLLQKMVLGCIMAGVTFAALPLLDRFMDRNIPHPCRHLPVAAKTEARSFLPQKNTADDAMGQMTGPTGIIGNRLMHLALLKCSRHVSMAILTSLAHGLTGPLLHTGSQTTDQDKQDNKLTCFP